MPNQDTIKLSKAGITLGSFFAKRKAYHNDMLLFFIIS